MGSFDRQLLFLICLLLLTPYASLGNLTTTLKKVGQMRRSVLIPKGAAHGIEEGERAAFVVPQTSQLIGYARSVKVLPEKSFWIFTELILPRKIQRKTTVEILLPKFLTKGLVSPLPSLKLKVIAPSSTGDEKSQHSWVKRKEGRDWFSFLGKTRGKNWSERKNFTQQAQWVARKGYENTYFPEPIKLRENQQHMLQFPKTVMEQTREVVKQKQYRELVQHLLRQRRAYEESFDTAIMD